MVKFCHCRESLVAIGRIRHPTADVGHGLRRIDEALDSSTYVAAYSRGYRENRNRLLQMG